MAFRIDSENNGVKGDLPVSLLETTILDNEDLKILRNIIEEIIQFCIQLFQVKELKLKIWQSVNG